MVSSEEIAQWIRAQVPDEDSCYEAEEDCLAVHPVHLMYQTNGVIMQVYCHVEGLAAKLAEWLQLKEASACSSGHAIGPSTGS